MGKRLFGARINPACNYCGHGRPTLDGNAILCCKKGVVTSSFSCRKFLYDPIKRNPSPMPLSVSFESYHITQFEL